MKVEEFPDTSVSLIAKIKDLRDESAWTEFETIYRPAIFRIARSKGLQYADAFDLVQQVLISVAAAIDSFEHRNDGTRFRHWLSRVTRNAILKAICRKPKDEASGSSGILQVLTDHPDSDPETETLVNLEIRRELFTQAASQIRDEVHQKTWLAFEYTVLNSMTAIQAAKALNMSVGSVYASRSRIMKRLRTAVREQEYY